MQYLIFTISYYHFKLLNNKSLLLFNNLNKTLVLFFILKWLNNNKIIIKMINK